MQRSSGRGQTEPLAALVAVVAVAAGLALYAGVLDESVTPDDDRTVAPLALDEAVETMATAGVVEPSKISAASDAAPQGWNANVTVRAGGSEWTQGPTPPADTQRATERVSVRLAPTAVEPGQIRMVVWQ